MDESLVERIVVSGSGTSYGVVAPSKRRGRLDEVDIVEKKSAESQWQYVLMTLGPMARFKNWLFDARWVPLSCLATRPEQDGFSFDYLAPVWDGESPVWRATYSEKLKCFELKRLRGNPYYKPTPA